MSRSGNQTVRCRLCGFEFDPAALACHVTCPLAGRCTLICCPNCGYQAVDESKSRLARMLRHAFRTPGPDQGSSQPRPEKDAVPLSHVVPGTEVEIRSLACMPPARSARLSAFGLVPGTRVVVLGRRPAPIVRIGETQLALSQEILDQIWVRPPRAPARGDHGRADGPRQG